MLDGPVVNEPVHQPPQSLVSSSIREEKVLKIEGVEGAGQGLQHLTLGLGHQLPHSLQCIADGEVGDVGCAVLEGREAAVLEAPVTRWVQGPSEHVAKEGLQELGPPAGHTLWPEGEGKQTGEAKSLQGLCQPPPRLGHPIQPLPWCTSSFEPWL